jgi:hypothetical protein
MGRRSGRRLWLPYLAFGRGGREGLRIFFSPTSPIGALRASARKTTRRASSPLLLCRRGGARRVRFLRPPREGARNAGRAMRPQPRVRVGWRAHERSHHGRAGGIRRSARSGFHGLLRTAPGGRAVVAHQYRGLPAPPVPSKEGTGLACRSLARGIAPGPPTWAVRARRGRHRHQRTIRPGRKFRAGPAIEHRARPPHPAPRIVTIAKRPSVWSGTERNLILEKRFVKRNSRPGLRHPPFGLQRKDRRSPDGAQRNPG